MRIGDRVGAIADKFKREVMELTGKPVQIALEKGEIDAYTL